MAASLQVQLTARDAAAARALAALIAQVPADAALHAAGPAAEGSRAWLDAIPGGERVALGEPAPGAVVVLDVHTRAAGDWLARLEAAATTAVGPVATVSPLTLGAGPTAVGGVAPDATDLAAADAAVRDHATAARPRTAVPSPACMLVTAAARDLAGPLDAGFAARCTEHALLHVVADDVLVALPGGAPAPPAPLAEEHEWRREQESLSPLGRARALARRAVAGLSVTLDGRALSGAVAGTQVHALELAAALHRTGALRLRIVVPPNLGPEAAAVLATLDGAELLPAIGIDQSTPRSDIVHRPYQVSSVDDAKLLQRVAARCIVTHQDLLGFHNPAYHATPETWESYRRLTRASLAAADLVVAFSRHVADDLLGEDLADAARIAVVPIGVDHRLPQLGAAPARPAAAAALAGAPFLACVGTDLRHKNRPFALDLLAALRAQGWDGRLALAGAHAAHGGSADDERGWRAAHPELDAAVVDLGAVDEPGKAWLYAEAAAVVYPTTSEGFGLIPFEAAAAGTPCLHAGGTALDELVPGTATLVPWNAAASAAAVLPLLRDPARAAAHCARISSAAAELRWDRTAEQLVALYDDVLARPATAAVTAAWTALSAQDRLGHLEGVHYELIDTIGPTGLALVGADPLLPEDAQRTLAGLARRPLTRRPLLGVLSGLRRVTARSGGE